MKRKIIFIFLPIFLLSFSFSMASASESIKVTSYKKNFVVIAPDHELASAIAARAEKFREKLFERLGWKQEWKEPVTFILVRENLPIKRKIKAIDHTLKYSARISLEKDFFQDCVVPEIVRFSIINQSEVHDPEALNNIYHYIPYWIFNAVFVYADPDSVVRCTDETRTNIISGKTLPLRELFEISPPPANHDLNKTAGAQAAAVLDYMLHLNRGKELFKNFLSSLNDREGWKCVFEDIYFDDFKSDEELNGRLIGSLRSPNRISFYFGKMPPSDSLILLNDSLAVRVSTDDGSREESKYASDLKSFKECCKAEIARRKLMSAYAALLKLKFEGDDTVRSVVDKYLDAYIMWGSKNHKQFWRLFCEAEKARKTLNAK